MSIVLNRGIEPGRPQTHVLVVGVGAYPHLNGGSESNTRPAVNSYGLEQLSSPPISAAAFTDWLPNLDNGGAPLGTVEVLLSPGEYVRSSGEKEAVDIPTMANLLKAYPRWLERVNSHVENIGIFYFCGHGLEKHGKTMLLPSDFGDPSIVNVNLNVIDFSVTYDCTLLESTASRFLFLIDACRETTLEVLTSRTSPTALLDSLKLKTKEIDAQILSSSNPGGQSHAIPGRVSFFTEALLESLQKFSAPAKNNRRWQVTTSSLGTAMKERMRRMQVPGPKKVRCHVGGQSNFDTVVHTFTGDAHVMSCVDCDPDTALEHAELMIDDGNGRVFERKIPVAVPYEDVIPAGQYNIGATFPAHQFTNATTPQLMVPPYTRCTVEVL
jgi:hypothetical protein